MFDLTRVREADGKRSAGFEELCVHLFGALCASSIQLIDRINGAGGDGGVEATAKTLDGRKVGLQAKYFVDALGSKQWQQIKESVNQAMTNHPDLSQYFVCVPRDRTPAQIAIWDEMQRTWASQYPKLTVTWVGRSELSKKLVMPEWAYLAVYWLGAPEFSLEWLITRTEAAIQQLHRRFTPELHNMTQAEVDLARALGLRNALQVYRDQCLRLVIETNKLLPQLKSAKWAPEAQSISALCDTVVLGAADVLHGIADGDLTKQSSAYGEVLCRLTETCSELGTATWSEQRRLQETKAPDADRHQCSSIAREALSVSKLAEEARATFVRYQQAQSKSVWLLKGEAGSGKSHLLATMARRALAEGHAAVLLLGEQFLDTAPLSVQVGEQLDWGHSFDNLLSCLCARAQEVGRPSVLIIDAINETPTRNLWMSQLVQLKLQVSSYPGVHLLVSCRDDWVEACVPPAVRDEAEEFHHRGFDLNFSQVVSAYFAGYNVAADAFPPLIPEFQNPLFLKTVCETYEDQKLPAEPLSFLKVLNAWELRICKKIEFAIDCPVTQTKAAIHQILLAMASAQASSLPQQTARDICQTAYPEPAASRSLYRHLQSFGFMEEVQRGQQTVVRLQYERFYDVRVAQAELDGIVDGATWEKLWEKILPNVGTWKRDAIAPARLFAYALLLPERFGIELVECNLPPADEHGWAHKADVVWEAWLDALAWRQVPENGEKVRQLFIRWANGGRGYEEVYQRLISFACIEQHPLNAEFFHALLVRLPLHKREVQWTVQLAHENLLPDSQSDLRNFVEWCDSARRRCSDEQAKLGAIVLLWLTSTTNQRNRDRATEAAIRLLDKRAQPAQTITDLFWDVNDPYVKERLLAMLAGVLPTLQRGDLQTLGPQICKRFFASPGEVPLNIMQREYARFMAEFCIQQQVLDEPLRSSTRPPYKTTPPQIWTEDEVQRYDKVQDYHDIASSLYPEEMGPGWYGDFGRYVMGSKVHQFVDVAKPDPNARTDYFRYPKEDARDARRYIWRRVIEMGWTPERFKEFERYLPSNGRQRPPIERIGKKFQWIGLYEYLGYLSDHRKFRKWSDRLCDGALAADLTLRDFNPALAFFKSADTDDDPPTLLEVQRPSSVPPMRTMQERTAWVQSDYGTFTPYLHVEIDGKPRLILSTHASYEETIGFGITRDKAEHASQWIDVRSYLVPEQRAVELAQRLSMRTFYGHGCEIPSAYACWPTEYPWHPMLNEVETTCSSGYPWLQESDGPLHGIECSLESEESRFTMPAPGVVREMSKSSTTGVLSGPRHCEGVGYRIDMANGSPVFWGTVKGSRLLAADFEAFVSWLRERQWALVWCAVSERTAKKGYEHFVAESHQSAVIILHSDKRLVELKAKFESLPFRYPNNL